MGLLQIELMIYPTIAPFIVENALHLSVLVYGNTALIVGSSYLFGALINRVLLRKYLPKVICEWGFYLFLVAVFLSYVFFIFFKLNLVTLMAPIIILGIGSGLAFPNLMSSNLKIFPKNAGIAMSIQAGLLTFIATGGIFVITLFSINSLEKLAYLYMIIIVLQFFIFYKIYRNNLI